MHNFKDQIDIFRSLCCALRPGTY